MKYLYKKKQLLVRVKNKIRVMESLPGRKCQISKTKENVQNMKYL